MTRSLIIFALLLTTTFPAGCAPAIDDGDNSPGGQAGFWPKNDVCGAWGPSWIVDSIVITDRGCELQTVDLDLARHETKETGLDCPCQCPADLETGVPTSIHVCSELDVWNQDTNAIETKIVKLYDDGWCREEVVDKNTGAVVVEAHVTGCPAGYPFYQDPVALARYEAARTSCR